LKIKIKKYRYNKSLRIASGCRKNVGFYVSYVYYISVFVGKVIDCRHMGGRSKKNSVMF
jgi:hypothetical protein